MIDFLRLAEVLKLDAVELIRQLKALEGEPLLPAPLKHSSADLSGKARRMTQRR